MKSLSAWFASNPYATAPDVLFYKECQNVTTHGKVLVTNKNLGLANIEVSFSIVGYDNPPALDPFVMGVIWHRAREKNYVPKALTLYGVELTDQFSVNNQALGV